MDDFIDTGSGGGIGFGLCDDITHAVIDEERMTSLRKYNTITGSENGEELCRLRRKRAGSILRTASAIMAAGLRYVIYAFATGAGRSWTGDSGAFRYADRPRDWERVGMSQNVVLQMVPLPGKTAMSISIMPQSDTRLHVATTTIDRLTDYVFHTPGSRKIRGVCSAALRSHPENLEFPFRTVRSSR